MTTSRQRVEFRTDQDLTPAKFSKTELQFTSPVTAVAPLLSVLSRINSISF